MVCETGSIFYGTVLHSRTPADQNTRMYLDKLTEFPECMQSTELLAG